MATMRVVQVWSCSSWSQAFPIEKIKIPGITKSKVIIIGIVRGPLFRGPLITYELVCPYLALSSKMFIQIRLIEICKFVMRGPLTGGPEKVPTTWPSRTAAVFACVLRRGGHSSGGHSKKRTKHSKTLEIMTPLAMTTNTATNMYMYMCIYIYI